jgi:hypothetical protein
MNDQLLGGSRACLIIGSNKLLQSYTKNDLLWIGQLAEYGNLIMGISVKLMTTKIKNYCTNTFNRLSTLKRKLTQD